MCFRNGLVTCQVCFQNKTLVEEYCVKASVTEHVFHLQWHNHVLQNIVHSLSWRGILLNLPVSIAGLIHYLYIDQLSRWFTADINYTKNAKQWIFLLIQQYNTQCNKIQYNLNEQMFKTVVSMKLLVRLLRHWDSFVETWFLHRRKPRPLYTKPWSDTKLYVRRQFGCPIT